jgi:predicted O-methyltransferase YrrM
MTTYQSDDPFMGLWRKVDEYIESALLPPDSALLEAMSDADAADLPAISVTPSQGKLLHLLALSIGAKRILEIGTLGGYSSIWLARALPRNGRLITLELDPKHVAVANGNIERAGLADRVDVRLGAALETLPRLQAEIVEPFDFVFIDADKQNIPAYFEWAVKLSRPGAVIIVDNVVRHGEVINAQSSDSGVPGVRALMDKLAMDSRVEATVIQTVGSKGYDGFLMAIIK